ncbi:MAG: hypothetical protein KKC75_00485 [Nanoarchaeota archaeon]|nr:hypothetical protein [Nanoarchaeota archaeon]MBU1946866.1 hypothetical protein [Nanoarchaeota archaeon]
MTKDIFAEFAGMLGISIFSGVIVAWFMGGQQIEGKAPWIYYLLFGSAALIMIYVRAYSKSNKY